MRSLPSGYALPEDRCAADVRRGARANATAGIAPCHRLHGARRQRRGHATADPSDVRPDGTGYPVGLDRNSSNRTGLTIPLISQRASPGERKNTLNKRETRGRRATARAITVVAPKLHNLETAQSAPQVVQPRMRLFVRSIVRHVQRGSSSDAERTKAPSSVASSMCACILHRAPCQSRRGAGAPSGLEEVAPALAPTRHASQVEEGICPIRTGRTTRNELGPRGAGKSARRQL
jgi:hypothetical protein